MITNTLITDRNPVIYSNVNRINKYDINTGTWYIHNAYIDASMIPDPRIQNCIMYYGKEVRDNTFNGITYLTQFKSDTVDKIGKSAFMNSGIKDIQLGQQTVELNESAFCDCRRLESFQTSKAKDNKISPYCFYNDINLTSIGDYSNIIELGMYSLYNCSKLPIDIRTIGDNNDNQLTVYNNALYGVDMSQSLDNKQCIDLSHRQHAIHFESDSFLANIRDVKSVIFGEKITNNSNGTGLLSGCPNLSGVDLGSLTALYPGFCNNCRSLLSVRGDNIQTLNIVSDQPHMIISSDIVSCDFRNITTKVYLDGTNVTPTTIRLDKLTELAPTRIKSALINEEESIDLSVYGFRNCSLFNYLNTSEGTLTSLIKIGLYSFDGCPLLSITLNNRTTNINPTAFSRTALTLSSINVKDFSGDSTSGIRDRVQGDTSLNVIILDNTLYIGCKDSRPYLTQTTKPTTQTVELWDIHNIAPFAFYNCISVGASGAWNLDGLTSIGDYAFYNNRDIIILNILSVKNTNKPINPSYIGECAFANTKLSSSTKPVAITLVSNIVNIGPSAFVNSNIIDTLTVKATDNLRIGDSAFENCSSLTKVTLSNSLQSYTIGNQAFKNCSSLTAFDGLNLNTVNTEYGCKLGDEAFYGTGIKSLTINVYTPLDDKYTNVAGRSCFEKSKIQKYVLYGSTCIYTRQFKDCKELTSVEFKGLLESWVGPSAFMGCTKLASITLSNFLDGFSDHMFDGCEKLNTITYKVPANTKCNLKRIGDYFISGTNVKTLTLDISGDVILEDGISMNAFSGSSIETLVLPNVYINTITEKYGDELQAVQVVLVSPIFKDENIDMVTTENFKFGRAYKNWHKLLREIKLYAIDKKIIIPACIFVTGGDACTYCRKFLANSVDGGATVDCNAFLQSIRLPENVLSDPNSIRPAFLCGVRNYEDRTWYYADADLVKDIPQLDSNEWLFPGVLFLYYDPKADIWLEFKAMRNGNSNLFFSTIPDKINTSYTNSTPDRNIYSAYTKMLNSLNDNGYKDLLYKFSDPSYLTNEHLNHFGYAGITPSAVENTQKHNLWGLSNKAKIKCRPEGATDNKTLKEYQIVTTTDLES